MAERPPRSRRRAASPPSWITRLGATTAAPSAVVDRGRQEADPDEGLRDRGRPRLFARRIGGLVHGRGSRGQPRALGGLALGLRASAHARDRQPDAAGHRARRQAAGRPRHAAVGHPGDGARSRQGARPLVARLVHRVRHFGGRKVASRSASPEREEAPSTRAISEAWTARRPFAWATEPETSLSPDGKWVAAIVGLITGERSFSSRQEPANRSPSRPKGTRVSGALFLPDGKRLLLTAIGEGSWRASLRACDRRRQDEGDLAGGIPNPDRHDVARRKVRRRHRSGPQGLSLPDRRRRADGGGRPGRPRGPRGLDGGQSIRCTSTSAASIRPAFRASTSATGKRELWKELTPPDPAGISTISPPRIAPDGKAYVYSYNRILSDLFLVEGVK